MTGSVNQVSLPARPECVIDARRAVGQVARDVGIHRDRVEDLLIAVSEAVTNAVEAHLAAGIDEPLAVGCRFDGTRLEVCIRDRGDGFDLDLVQARPRLTGDESLASERGWGIQLMQTLVDDVSFRSSGDGTAVKLVVAVQPDR